MKKLYKSIEAKQKLMKLYDEKLAGLNIAYENLDITTRFGNTRVIKTGNINGNTIVIFHGINAGAPITIEAVKELRNDFLIYAIDTIGQATKSDETRIDILDDSYGIWASEVLNNLNVKSSAFIGISYGAYILQKLIIYNPTVVSKAVFVVPSGFVNGKLGTSLSKLTFPLIRYLITKKDKHLKSFLNAFLPEEDEFMFKLQKEMLTGLNMDYRRPALIKKEQVTKFTNPVFMLVVEDDVFFPGQEAIRRAKEVFRNVEDTFIIKGAKHMPSQSDFPVIQEKIRAWLKS